jgi:hypothetical protein
MPIAVPLDTGIINSWITLSVDKLTTGLTAKVRNGVACQNSSTVFVWREGSADTAYAREREHALCSPLQQEPSTDRESPTVCASVVLLDEPCTTSLLAARHHPSIR